MSYISKYLAYVSVSFALQIKGMFLMQRSKFTRSNSSTLVENTRCFLKVLFSLLTRWSLAYFFTSFSESKNTNLHWTILVTLWDESFLGSDLKHLRAICNRPSSNKFVLSSHDSLFTEPWFLLFTFAVLQNIFFHLVHWLQGHEFCITEEIFWAIK